ncbi:hypothetical protein DICPUDRAFT_149247 [Dictyostelium purpureum]|uniref:Uncharacterized protein n=1 Tax=Dictyostelium purpureum TaxID=5786 RepID=F0ZD71_DICPU|nr:uncharacterized protein DICPUDRAFT_149247 [Dictyostelium purpureum]EGC38085.1 hypothetical protein DICPUDRAFT_149247 [Dictyostelium purpureum]|eukprot:XP_003285392.1 hypothetical protein DICPUDRAFT_149247 [Dictyostelium purpureum]
MNETILLNNNNLIPKEWFKQPELLDDSDFIESIKIFEKEIGQFPKDRYKNLEGIKKNHVFYFPTFLKETRNEKKIKILSSTIMIWLFIIDQDFKKLKENNNLLKNQQKLLNILIDPTEKVPHDQQEKVTIVLKKLLKEITGGNIFINNYFITSVFNYISSIESTDGNKNSYLHIIDSCNLLQWIEIKKKRGECVLNSELLFLSDPRYIRLKNISNLLFSFENETFSNIGGSYSNKTKIETLVGEFKQYEDSLNSSYGFNDCLLYMIKCLKYSVTGNILLKNNK